jgi:hypothetical protein
MTNGNEEFWKALHERVQKRLKKEVDRKTFLNPLLRVGNVEVVSIDPEKCAIHSVVHIECRPQDIYDPEVTNQINKMLQVAGNYLTCEGWIKAGIPYRNHAIIKPMTSKAP